MGFKLYTGDNPKIFFTSMLYAWLLMIVFRLVILDVLFTGLLHIAIPQLVKMGIDLVFMLLMWYPIEKRLLALQKQQ